MGTGFLNGRIAILSMRFFIRRCAVVWVTQWWDHDKNGSRGRPGCHQRQFFKPFFGLSWVEQGEVDLEGTI